MVEHAHMMPEAIQSLTVHDKQVCSSRPSVRISRVLVFVVCRVEAELVVYLGEV